MTKKVLFAVLLLSQLATGNVDVENDLSEKFELSGYIDACFTQWGSYNAVPSREFSVRRSGFEINAELSETIMAETKVEVRPDQVFLKNALVQWAPAEPVRLRAGQFKMETLLGGDLSSWNLNLLSRPLVYDLAENLTFAGRDIGIDVRVDLPRFSGIELRGTAGVFNGDQRGDEKIDNELLYTFRGEIEIPAIDLTLGASAASHRQGAVDLTLPDGYSTSAKQNSFSVDLSYKYKITNWYDVSACAEMTSGDNWSLTDVLAGEEPATYNGFWGSVTGAFHPLNVSGIDMVTLTAGYDKLTPNTDLDESYSSRFSVIGAIYPSENFRFRFGGIRNDVSSITVSENYTDFVAEVGLRF